MSEKKKGRERNNFYEFFSRSLEEYRYDGVEVSKWRDGGNNIQQEMNCLMQWERVKRTRIEKNEEDDGPFTVFGKARTRSINSKMSMA